MTIKVKINIPDNGELAGKLMAKAFAKIIKKRVNQLPQEQRLAVYEEILKFRNKSQ